MENPKPIKPNFSSVFTIMKANKTALFRMWFIVVSIYLISLLFGFGIFMITIGLLFTIRRIIIFWSPSRTWLMKTMGIKIPEPYHQLQDKSILYQRLISIYHIGISLIYVLIGIFMMKLGIDYLLRHGFLGQNLIYLIFYDDM